MDASADQKTKQLYEFGPFRVDADKELLLRDDEAVPLSPKAFQVLLVLMRHSKQVVTKDDLLKTIWPDTFVEEANLSRNIFLLRKALGGNLHDHQYIVTVPGHGYRFAEDVQLVPESKVDIVAASHSTVQVQVKETRPWGWVAVVAVLLVIAAVGAYKLFSHRTPVITEKDTVVLADFTNSTGDPVFDGTLREGLAVELEQSPFLSLIPYQRIQRTLKMMGQPADAKLSPAIAQDVCERTGGTAMLDGSIAQVGTRYLLTLKAVNCSDGDSLASSEAEANDKSHVLDALGKAASGIRKKLGESLSTVQRFGTPLEQATTQSLEALQAYSLGRRAMAGNNWAAAVPFFQRAIQLDPTFAMAYARAGMSYRNLGEPKLGAENSRRAYELRAQASELERFYIESHYYLVGVGNLERAVEVFQMWAQTYPRDWVPRIDLCDAYSVLGQPEKALPEAMATVRLNPTGEGYANLVDAYLSLNRLNEARAAAAEAQAKGFDSPGLRNALFLVDFLEDDTTAMAEQVAWAKEKPGVENTLLRQEANRAAYLGKLGQARTLSREALGSARRAGELEVAAVYEADDALREALFGNSAEARNRAREALGLSNGSDVQFRAAFAFARAGDASRAETLANDLENRFPDNTIVHSYYLPTIRAELALRRNDPSRAIEALQPALPYELSRNGPLYPAYVRAESYLAAHRGDEAVTESRKIIGHRGLVANDPIGALAYLQLARAYAMSGDESKAKAEYEEFLTLWKDSDPDVPVLKQAKAEYARLK